MEQIVDLHIHSRYAYATSNNMDVAGIYYWAKIKGISLVGTGDCTHPSWLRELEQKLEIGSNGFYTVKPSITKEYDRNIPLSCVEQELFFIPTVEVSLIYSSDNRVRKIHYILVLPDFETVHELNKILATKGNLVADGRPTFGMDSHQLLNILSSVSNNFLIIPAHVWTPWFGIFGSKSGFDTLKEVFGDRSDQIAAVETGLSSDPAMNWQIEELRKRSIVSFSDAHSPRKLGREATVLKNINTYYDLITAIKRNDDNLVGTIEFFPAEGKYHLDGHRNCAVSCVPAQTAAINGVCPVCGKSLTVGVLSRVQTVTDKFPALDKQEYSKQVEYIIPLAEILAAQEGIKNITSTKIEKMYQQLITLFGNELFILRKLNSERLITAGFNKLATHLEDMRTKKITIIPGYDGQYGKIILPSYENGSSNEQLSLGF